MQSPQESTLAAVFTYIEIAPPFTRLLQLEQAGIETVYILLDTHTLEAARSEQVTLINEGLTTNILRHYETAAKTMKIEFWDTGDITREEEKLHFYRAHVPSNHALNIFICQHAMPNLSQHTNILRTGTITTYPLIPFYKKKSREKIPEMNAFSLTEKASNLIQQEKNPCLCFQENRFDLVNAQWLFQIFASFISVRCKPDSQNYSEANQLIKDYNTQVELLDKAQAAFEDTHKQCYSSEYPGFFLKSRHNNNRTNKETLEENIHMLLSNISRLCNPYKQIKQNLDIQPNIFAIYDDLVPSFL